MQDGHGRTDKLGLDPLRAALSEVRQPKVDGVGVFRDGVCEVGELKGKGGDLGVALCRDDLFRKRRSCQAEQSSRERSENEPESLAPTRVSAKAED